MRRLSFDQFEFDGFESEQSLELAISSPPQHPDLKALLQTCGASASSGPPPMPGWARWVEVAELLQRHVGLVLPHPSQWREAALLSDQWDDLELGVAAGPVLLWYHWWTTA